MVTVRRRYEKLLDEQLIEIAPRLERHITNLVSTVPFVDRVSVRAKAIDSFVKKSEKSEPDGTKKYDYPFDQITDMIGARVIVLFEPIVSDVNRVIEQYFTLAESQKKEPESHSEFGYHGHHCLLMLPTELLPDPAAEDLPECFELQVKTVHQHAWSEASHDLAYKEGSPLTFEQRRQIAYAAASDWGADQIFSQLAKELGVLPEDVG